MYLIDHHKTLSLLSYLPCYIWWVKAQHVWAFPKYGAGLNYHLILIDLRCYWE